MAGRGRTAAAIGCLVLLAAACSSGGGSAGPRPSAGATTATAATGPARPAGPAADLSTPLTGGRGPYIGASSPVDLRGTGYVQQEYAAAGTATSYRPAAAETPDGRWTFTPGGTAPYRTRILVRRPAKAADFSGTVIVEWLNVSGGVDADPEWASLHEEITRRGDAWVGVSAQQIGVSGGAVVTPVKVAGAEDAGKGLRTIDPARYSSLRHPGDGYAYDIYTQVARGLRGGAALGGLRPRQVVAAGESQSAFALVTYYNGVQPLTRAFDGFFVHSRGAAGLPLAAPGKSADLAGSLGGVPTIFRTDQAAPVMDIQTETDVISFLSSAKVRQPDSDRFRLWEVPGTAHADAHLVGALANTVDCGVPINDGPMHLVAKAAWRALAVWVGGGAAPVTAPRLSLTAGTPPLARRNADGLALGGVRTPPVDVPVAALSGVPGPKQSTICLLLGSAKPLPAARLAQLYPSRAVYQQRYDAAADATIKAGFVLPEDRAALLGFATPARIAA